MGTSSGWTDATGSYYWTTVTYTVTPNNPWGQYYVGVDPCNEPEVKKKRNYQAENNLVKEF